MRVPIRKGGKYTFLKPDPCITQEKYDELVKKLEHLIKISRPRTSEEVQRLALMGDFSENAAYQMAKGKLRGINQRILDIEEHLKIATIINPQTDFETVQLGHTVTVEVNNKIKDFLILGSSETDPASGIISHNSPIGQALMGQKIGDIIKIKLTDKIIEYKIIKIG